jgi:hypothetical protein
MYLSNKYTVWYIDIVERARNRILADGVYFERHHVIPKSLGGGNSAYNLVKLTAREHFICHRLLPKMLSNEIHIMKMRCALMMMTGGNSGKRYVPCSLVFQRLRVQLSESMKGRDSPTKGMTLKPLTDEHKAKMSRTRKDRGLGEQAKYHLKPQFGDRNIMRNAEFISVYKQKITGRKMIVDETGRRRWHYPE